MRVARNQIANPEEHHWRSLVQAEFPRPRHGIGRIANVTRVAQRERLPARHGSVRGDLVSVVKQHSRADVKSLQQKYVVCSLRGSQVQGPAIGHAVFVKRMAVTKRVEPKAHVRAMRNSNGHVSANSKSRHLHAHADWNAALR